MLAARRRGLKTMNSLLISALIGLQAFVVLYLALHDWVPLGALNDVKAVQAADSRGKLLLITAISASPFAVGLAASVFYFGHAYPLWLLAWLSISYVGLQAGQFRAWWVPYFFISEPARAARYHEMFARTHAFLPERNGIRPNTLHLIFNAALVAILTLLTVLILAG